MLPELSSRLLARMAEGVPVTDVKIVIENGGIGYEIT
jgi:hypothetical protein